MAGTVTFRHSASSATDATTYTFVGATLGGEEFCIVGPTNSVATTRTGSTVTANGVSASQTIGVTSGGGGNARAEIWIATNTGASGDVVVTWSGGCLGCTIGVYSAAGLSGTSASATGSSTADPMSASLSIPADGIAVGIAANEDGGATTWTNLTEGYDITNFAGSGNSSASGASTSTGSSISPTITANPANPISRAAMALASWGPATGQPTIKRFGGIKHMARGVGHMQGRAQWAAAA